jgi:hypothetical protein
MALRLRRFFKLQTVFILFDEGAQPVDMREQGVPWLRVQSDRKPPQPIDRNCPATPMHIGGK